MFQTTYLIGDGRVLSVVREYLYLKGNAEC